MVAYQGKLDFCCCIPRFGDKSDTPLKFSSSPLKIGLLPQKEAENYLPTMNFQMLLLLVSASL